MKEQITERESAFAEAENLGRNKALKVLNRISSIFSDGYDNYTIKPVDDLKCQWDFEVFDNDTNDLIGIIEAKDRKMISTDDRLTNQGAQLEAQKYRAMLRISENKVIPSFYLCTFLDAVYYIWDLEETVVSFDTRMCNKTTAVLEGKVEKECCYFPLSEAKFSGIF